MPLFLPTPACLAHALGACGTSLRQFVSVKDAGLRAQSGVMLKNLITFTCANCLSARQGSQAGRGAGGQLGVGHSDRLDG